MTRRATAGPLLLVAAAMAAACALQVRASALASPFEPSMTQWADDAPALTPAQSWVAPILGTADAHGWQPRTVGAVAVALAGGRPAITWASGILAALFVGVAAFALRRLGSRWLPAVAAPLAVVASGALSAAPALAVGVAWQAVLAAALLGLGTGTATRVAPTVRDSILLALALALAIDGEASWLILSLPVVPLLARRGRRMAAALTVVLACAGAAHAVAAIVETLRAMPSGPGAASLAVSVAEAARVAFLGPGAATGSWLDGFRAAGSGWLAVWGLAGTVLAAGGLVALGTDRARAWFVLSWAVAAASLAAVRSPLDRGPAMLLLTTSGSALVALGATWLADRVSARAAAAAVGVAIMVPAVLHAAWPAAPARPFDGRAGAAYRVAILSAASPARAAFVSDLPALDRLVLGVPGRERAELHGAARIPRDPAVVRRFLDAGYSVYALPAARAELAARGVDFTDVPLAHATLGRFLDTLPVGTLAAVAASGGAGEALRHSPLLVAGRLGAVAHRVPAAFAFCLLGRVEGRGALEAASPISATLAVRAGDGAAGAPMPASVFLTADSREAVVDVPRRARVSAQSGVAVAVLDAFGDLAGRLVVDQTTGYQVRVARDTLTLGRADRLTECRSVAPGRPIDITGLATNGAVGWGVNGSMSATPPRLVLSVAAAAPIEVRPEARQSSGLVRLGSLPARLTASSQGAAFRVCAAMATERLLFDTANQRAAVLDLGSDDGAFGAGWHLAELDGGVPFRWTLGEARLFIRLDAGTALRVTLDASPAAVPPPAIRLDVNGLSLAERTMTAGVAGYSWDVPADAWRAGLNQVVLHVSPTVQGTTDPRILGAAVRGIRFEKP
jgi:hypothetical protein